MELKLIPDPDMYIFFEKIARGGVSYISNSKANSKYFESDESKQDSKHLIYLIYGYKYANNLYGYTMSKFLPTSGFKWTNPK